MLDIYLCLAAVSKLIVSKAFDDEAEGHIMAVIA